MDAPASTPVLEGQGREQARRDAADQGADHGNPRVRPVGAALPGDGQDRVGNPRAEVTGRVDRVPGGAAQGNPDTDDEQGDPEGAQPAEAARVPW